MLKSLCIVLVISTCVYSRDSSAILSRLFNKSPSHSSPLILVLDRNSLRPYTHDRSYASAQESVEEADDSLQYLLEHLVQKSRPKSYAAPHKHLKSRDRNAYRPNQHSHSFAKKQDERESNALRSPIYRSLLSLRNSLRCGARDECQDECSQNYKGIREQKCNNKCEVKFDCEEPTTPKSCDNCGIDYEACNDSETGNCDEGGSTKGELLVTEKPGCTRC